jgi:integrase
MLSPARACEVITETSAKTDVLASDTMALPCQTEKRRKRSLARRFQQGSISKMGNWYVVRFRKDENGARKLTYEKICPVSGPGYLPVGQRKRRAAEILTEQGINEAQTFYAEHGETFSQRAASFLRESEKRKRNPAKPATLDGWRRILSNHLNPAIGDTPLANIENGTLKAVISSLYEKNLSPQTIVTYANLLKLVVGSAVDENGNQLFARKWNNDFADLPVLTRQKQPAFTAEQTAKIVGLAHGKYRVLFALFAATGMRAGEALGLPVENIDLGRNIITVAQSSWHGQIQPPKTGAAIREIDITPEIAEVLREYIDGRTSGLLFQTRSGKPLSQTTIARRHLHPALAAIGAEKASFHAFRRFRATHLRKQGCNEDLVKFWLGHAKAGITDTYSKLFLDEMFRQQEAKRVGIGFEISPIVRTVRKIEEREAA